MPPSSVTSSCGITASAPSGSGAPVKMRYASPPVSGRSESAPAATRPARRSRAGAPATAPRVSSPRRAYPSIDELGQGGMSALAVTSSASAR